MQDKMGNAVKGRVKELKCLHEIWDICEKRGISLEEVLQRIVDMVPGAWQYPEIACARIALREGEEFGTENFEEAHWSQESDIEVHGSKIGTLEVGYLEERPEKRWRSFPEGRESIARLPRQNAGLCD